MAALRSGAPAGSPEKQEEDRRHREGQERQSPDLFQLRIEPGKGEDQKRQESCGKECPEQDRYEKAGPQKSACKEKIEAVPEADASSGQEGGSGQEQSRQETARDLPDIRDDTPVQKVPVPKQLKNTEQDEQKERYSTCPEVQDGQD